MKNYIKQQIKDLKIGDVFVIHIDNLKEDDFSKHWKYLTYIFKKNSKDYKIISSNKTNTVISFLDVKLINCLHLTHEFNPDTIVYKLTCPVEKQKFVEYIIKELNKDLMAIVDTIEKLKHRERIQRFK